MTGRELAAGARGYMITDTLRRYALRMTTGVLFASLVACGSAPPVIDSSTIPAIVDETGEIDEERAAQVVERLAADAGNPQAFAELIRATGSLSRSPLYTGNRVELMIDGPETYTAMFREIDAAEQSIYLETFIFANDEVGQRFADALTAKARAGLDVRLIFDSIGSVASGDEFFDSMEESGVKVIEFNDINPLDGGNPLDANNRDHRKLLIVDGRVAFTGGVNLSRTYSSRPGQQDRDEFLEDGWRDTHVAIYGPAVQGIIDVFEESWRLSDGAPGGWLRARENHTPGNDDLFVLNAYGGDDIESPIYHAYLQAIRLAQRRVWITQAYFVPDKPFLRALRAASARGVDVRIIVPGLSDSTLVMNASRSYYGRMLEAGVRLFETQTSMLHAKTAVVDGVWSTVGSANLDPRSKLHNDEVNVVVIGADFGSLMERQFEKDLGEAGEVSYEDWQERGIGTRFKEFYSRLFAYWL